MGRDDLRREPPRRWRFTPTDLAYLRTLRIDPADIEAPTICEACEGTGQTEEGLVCQTCRGLGSLDL